MDSSAGSAHTEIEAAAQELMGGNLERAESMCRRVAVTAPEERALRDNVLGLILGARGRADAALAEFRSAYDLWPGHAGICFNLGRALAQRGSFDEALVCLERAAALAPDYPDAHLALAAACEAAGRPAIASYRRAFELDPDNAGARDGLVRALLKAGEFEAARRHLVEFLAARPDDAGLLHNLGLAHHQLGQQLLATATLWQALAIAPGRSETHYVLGSAQREAGDLEDAAASFEKAVELAPGEARYHHRLGELRIRMRDPERAAASLRRALELDPDNATAHHELGELLQRQGRLEPAAAHLERSLELEPGVPDTVNDLGITYREQGRLADAERCFRRYLELRPGDAGVYKNLGNVALERGEIDQAQAHYELALEKSPGDAYARLNRSYLLLMKGAFAEGWPAYEARLEVEQWEGVGWMSRWRGEPLGGRSILVRGEQGLGDEIMFASILPEIVDEAASCVIECAPKLERLFRGSFPRATVVAHERDLQGAGILRPELPRMPALDVQVPMGSLPLYRRRAPADFPRHAGYLRADAGRVAYWKERLAALGPGLKVGVSWRGGLRRTRTAYRSLPLAALAPLLRLDGAQFASLQYGECGDEIARLRGEEGITVSHWQEAIDDYDETAALVTALDLVVSVCTAVVHLTGALGRPAWVLTPFVPEWRYGRTGDAMPWYPSVRLFRQTALGDWTDVLQRVQAGLQDLVSTHRAGS